MNREDIKNYIYNKKNDIDNNTLEYYTNYFWVLVNSTQILGSNNIEMIIDNALLYASKIEFYDENSDIYKELGPDCKGLREPVSKTIYIRNNLEEPLREIVIYHELHHAAQTNPLNDEVGINQDFNMGRMIMEAQTQYFAEKVYSMVHGIEFEEKEITSEKLRMSSGGVVISSLHNYEMYDSILSKLSIMLGVTKDYFVSINYLYENNIGLDKLKQLYESSKEKYKFPYEFEDFLFRLDYVYCVDLIAYKENPDKELLLKGEETKNSYCIYSNKAATLSLHKEFEVIDDLDTKYFLCLLDNGGDYNSFAKYMLKNKSRALAQQIIGIEISSNDNKKQI